MSVLGARSGPCKRAAPVAGGGRLARAALVPVLAAIWLVVPLSGVGGQSARATQTQVEAVFLFHFAEFVEWPAAAFASPASPFCIGVLGADPFDAVLDETVRDERAAGRAIVVHRFTSVDDAVTCHIVFVSGSERGRMRAIVAALAGRSVLTVADVDGFARQGGLIELAVGGGKTRLKINADAARAAGLTISSKLLRSAEIVSSAK